MRLREEDLNRRRKAVKTKSSRPPSFFSVLLLLLLLLVGGLYAYEKRYDLLEPVAPQVKLVEERITALIRRINPQGRKAPQSESISIQEQINLDVTRDFISREELQELLSSNFVALNTKVDKFIAQVDKLQQDVEYVGALGRSVRGQLEGVEKRLGGVETKLNRIEGRIGVLEDNMTEVEKSIASQETRFTKTMKAQEKQLRSLALRLEEIDTLLQAETETTAARMRLINQELENLKKSAASLESANDAQQRSITQLERTISILNARLIELER